MKAPTLKEELELIKAQGELERRKEAQTSAVAELKKLNRIILEKKNEFDQKLPDYIKAMKERAASGKNFYDIVVCTFENSPPTWKSQVANHVVQTFQDQGLGTVISREACEPDGSSEYPRYITKVTVFW